MSGDVEYLRLSPGRHLGEIFFRRAAELGDRGFIKLQRGDAFDDVSWRDVGATVRSIVLALDRLGLGAKTPVAIIGENSLGWLCADLATLSGGFPNVVVPPASSDAMLLKVLGHSGCRAAFVENSTGVGRLLNLKGQLPALAHIIVMDSGEEGRGYAIGWEELIQIGRQSEPGRLVEILQAVHPNDLATIMYTAGSTGEPKGVMRTHQNMLSNITNGGAISVSRPDELTVIVLSLNHLFGRFGILKSAVTGRTTALIEATELTIDLSVLELLAGTSMAVVPRVMERIWNAILDRGDNRDLWRELEELDRCRSFSAVGAAGRGRYDDIKERLKTAVRRALGGRMKYISYGGAAMPPRIMRFFELVEIPLIGSYGSTECGGVTLCGVGENRPGSLGKPFPNVEIRIAEDSEILVRGPTVTPGYFKNPEATSEAIDEEGWFHSGDLGVIDDDGSLRIIGRKKDVFYCADGSNIYPGLIELRLENEPFVRQAVLLGDHRPFIAALIIPDRERIAAELGRHPASLVETDIEPAVWHAVERVNTGLEHYEKIRGFRLMSEDFPTAVRSVNVFEKVKVDRGEVAQRYAAEIDGIYAAEEDKR